MSCHMTFLLLSIQWRAEEKMKKKLNLFLVNVYNVLVRYKIVK